MKYLHIFGVIGILIIAAVIFVIRPFGDGLSPYNEEDVEYETIVVETKTPKFETLPVSDEQVLEDYPDAAQIAAEIPDAPTVTNTGIEVSTTEKQIQVTDSIKHSIPLESIRGGGPLKDGIPSIDEPKFVSIDEAEALLDDDSFGMAVSINGDSRYYPFDILVHHEIVNDVIGGEPVAVTYCPLCVSAITFSRIVNGETMSFGVSGLLNNNNLLMYNRTPESPRFEVDMHIETLWQQAIGEAVVGPLTGTELAVVPADNIFWPDWKSANPSGTVLSRDTGHVRAYGRDPYGSYYTDNNSIYFPTSNTDNRLETKEVIFGIKEGGATKAYTEEALGRDNVVNDTVGGVAVVATQDPNTRVTRIFNRSVNGTVLTFTRSGSNMKDDQTGSVWTFEGKSISGTYEGANLDHIDQIREFWFSWVAFHPETAIYN